MKFNLILVGTIILFWAANLYPSQLNIVYPNINGIGDQSFGLAALELALEKSGANYNLVVHKEEMSNERIRERIESGQISIADFGTSPEYEKKLRPIYIPIDYGLNGWRLFIIDKDRMEQFREIHSLEDLRVMTAGQGMGWSDIDILENSGIPVAQGHQIDNLFKMVNAGRFDFFPLGANEIYSLLEKYEDDCPEVTIEQTLILHYPFARLFFVNKENTKLADAVEKGLIQAMDDGSFWQLFKNHKSNRDLFTKAFLQNRTMIYIDNPFTTAAFRKIPEKYFFSLSFVKEETN